MSDKLKISKRSNIKKVFSIRIKEEIVNKLDELSKETNRSRNELINIMLEYGINNCEITDKE